MNIWILPLGYWLLDFAALASLIMLAALAVRPVVRRPGVRVGLAWGTWFGLMLLVVLTVWPAWPRLALRQSLANAGTSTFGDREQLEPAPAREAASLAFQS